MAVKPHASPVLHAINYLLGELDERYLETLRAFGGLQSYPSRAKDPDPVDYSTGSVGIGATAPIWGALARRYVASRESGSSPADTAAHGRQYSLVGDAELDEGACWEAILDPMVGELGEVVWIVDLNRQSLDRVVPNIGATRLQGMFDAAGWQVLTVKYGRLLEELFTRPGGAGAAAADRRHVQPGVPAAAALHRRTQLRERLPGADPELAALVAELDDATLHAAVRNLGGHDLAALGEAFARHRRQPAHGDLRLHGEGLRAGHRGAPAEPLLAAHRRPSSASWPQRSGTDPAAPWARFADGTPAARLCAEVADRLRREPVRPAAVPPIPTDIGRTPSGHRHHPGRARPRAARPDPLRARGGPPGGHAVPGRRAPRPTSAAG